MLRKLFCILDKRTIIVKITDGLGNQMFQYAFGQGLKYKYGVRVIYDISWYEDIKKDVNYNDYTIDSIGTVSSGTCVWNYCLDKFKALSFEKNKTHVRGFFRKLFKIHKYGINIAEYNEIQDTSPKEVKDFDKLINKFNAYVGYFQDEKFFLNVRNQLIKDFEFPDLQEEDRMLAKDIESQNSVFIHIRRGDYVNIDTTLQLEYYRKAIEYICSKVDDPVFFVFCNYQDYEWVKENLNLDVKYIFTTNKENPRANIDDMHLMSKCKHAIIANSTFSWWGAWLNTNPNKIVVAPQDWLINNFRGNPACDDWIKIEN